jgi:hypothetical protein
VISSSTPFLRSRSSAANRYRPIALGVLAAAVFVVPRAEAQAPQSSDAQIILSGTWLQANALPLDRDAVQSGSLSVGLRKNGWSFEVGGLRIARTLSTVEGGALSVGRLVHWKSLTIVPSVGVLGGKAYASADTTGYDWIAAGGTTGHTPRYTYSDGGTFGGGIGVAVDLPLYRAVAARGTVSQWFFSGASLEDNRSRTLLGVGLSVRLGR